MVKEMSKRSFLILSLYYLPPCVPSQFSLHFQAPQLLWPNYHLGSKYFHWMAAHSNPTWITFTKRRCPFAIAIIQLNFPPLRIQDVSMPSTPLKCINFVTDTCSLQRVLVHTCEIAILTCDGNKDTSQYMLFSNKLSTFIDLLNYRLDVSNSLQGSIFLV